MADEIKQKIVLEGEKEYSAALKEANRNLKTLRSELKAETAELGANASAQQKNETKARSLKKQIEQQEKVVATLQKALKEVKERYGDNNEEVAKWEQKLNNARYSLANMNNQLQTTEAALKSSEDALRESGDAYDEAADAANNFADATGAAEQTANMISFQSVINAADGLTEKLRSAIGFIKEVSQAAWDWMKESGSWADELTTNATKWGIDRQTLQGWNFAARMVDTDVETIARSFTKLTNRSDTVNKKLEEIGITANKGVSAQELFWQVVESISAMEDANAQNDAAMDIFGRSFQDLLPLIQAGRAAWEGYVEEAEKSGFVLSEDQLNNLTAFDDAWQRMDTSVLALKHTLASELAPAFETIATSLGSLVTTFTEWAKSDEGKETLKGLGDALNEVIKSLSSESNFQSLVEGATNVIKGLTDALGWISEHKQEVVTGIEAIGLAFAGLKISASVLKGLMMIKGIKWLGGGGAAAAAGKGATTATAAAAGGGSTWLSSFLTSTGAKVAGGGLSFLTTLFGDLLRPADPTRGEAIEIEIYGGGQEKNGVTVADVSDVPGVTPEQMQAAQEFWDAWRMFAKDPNEANESAFDEMWDKAAEAFGGEDSELFNKLNELTEELKDSTPDDAWTEIEDLPENLFRVLDSELWNGNQLTSEDVSGFASLPDGIEKAAQAGVAAGMSGISVNLDGYRVGSLVAPYVSQQIAQSILF